MSATLTFSEQLARVAHQGTYTRDRTMRIVLEPTPTCPMTVIDDDGEMEPCGKSSVAWCLSDHHEFPIALVGVCHDHENELGNELAEILVKRDRFDTVMW